MTPLSQPQWLILLAALLSVLGILLLLLLSEPAPAESAQQRQFDYDQTQRDLQAEYRKARKE